MPGSLSRASLLLLLLIALVSSCRRTPPPAPPAPRAPQTSGTLRVAGLHGPVTVGRDRWGIPHITASSTDDLFFAQGFVQAQDRLFQMDLWRRASQGRLSETLGANFIERDAMTRRFQFRGDIEREWASYGPDTRRIVTAFTRGINAWVSIARADPPEEFVLAGWAPEAWKPEDLLNRTDAFVASGDAQDDLLRARLAAAIGVATVDRLLPLADGRRLEASPGIDLSAITYVVPETIRRMGTPAFFTALAGPVTAAPRPGGGAGGGDTEARGRLQPDIVRPFGAGSAAFAVAPSRSATGAPLLAVSQSRRADVPSARYLVHLMAPGFNVVGGTSPWLPGVAVGHNGHIAWGTVPAALDTQDVFVERVNPADAHQVQRNGRWEDMTVELERVDVKGRTTPFQFERLHTSNGVVVAIDRERHLAYTLRWTGTEYGSAGELAALAVNRATNWTEFQQAVSRWKMPSVDVVYADVEDHIARVPVGMAALRGEANGTLPAPGWTGSHAWRASEPVRGAEFDPRGGVVLSAPGPAARAARLAELLAPGDRSPSDLRVVQLDIVAPGASLLLPVLERAGPTAAEQERLRRRLLAWDRRMDGASADARLYASWEAAMAIALARRRVPSEFVDDVAARIDVGSVMSRPTPAWFDGNLAVDRDRVMLEALTAAAARAGVGSDAPTITFVHPLSAFDEARRRFNVGAFPRLGNADTIFTTTDRSVSSFRAVFDLSDWNRSMVMLAPGQSGSPASVHYDDLAASWSAGEYVSLAFSEAAVRQATTETLTLAPR